MLGARTTEGAPYVLWGWNPAPQTECHCYGKWEICSGVVGEATLYSILAQGVVK